MECTHPMKVWKPNLNVEDKKIKFTDPKDTNYELITIPCGHCTACKLNYAQEWAVRCSLETKNWKNSYFLTLTYSNEKLYYTEDQPYHPSLNKKHIQLFIKKLRKKYGKLKYFCCGEYGPTTGRPHYHMILWQNMRINDLKGVNSLISIEASKYMTSNEIEQIWGNGGVTIGYNNYNTANYVAKYTLKKLKQKEKYEDYGLNEAFLTCSQGIGYNYLEKKDEWKHDTIIISKKNQKTQSATKIQTKIPKQLVKKIKELDESAENEIKAQRTQSGINFKREQIRLSQIKNRDSILEQKERQLKDNINRNKI